MGILKDGETGYRGKRIINNHDSPSKIRNKKTSITLNYNPNLLFLSGIN